MTPIRAALLILLTLASAAPAGVSQTSEATSPQAVLTIEAMKFSQRSRSFTAIDIRFTNTSAQALSWWTIGIEAYDKDGNYLGRGDGLVTDIGPGESQVHDVLIETRAKAIQNWRATLTGVRGYGSFESLTPLYWLEVKDPQPMAPTKKTKPHAPSTKKATP
jgi:hypothetical protein